jgi:hypothetical protein
MPVRGTVKAAPRPRVVKYAIRGALVSRVDMVVVVVVVVVVEIMTGSNCLLEFFKCFMER